MILRGCLAFAERLVIDQRATTDASDSQIIDTAVPSSSSSWLSGARSGRGSKDSGFPDSFPGVQMITCLL